MSTLGFGDGLDPAAFIREFWQKKPLLMRGALPDPGLGLSADELAGLALEPDVEARLVTRDPEGLIQLREPPFSESDFTDLPARDWTLLVQDVDKHLPALGDFLDLFDFLPGWRLDDLMISAAAPGGGVGPHIDQYDVFLCQVTGHRRWLIGEPGPYPERGDTPLRQIGNFAPTADMTLGPGDVLYLPPGVPHDGIAQDLCTTWSVGFRAPSLADLLSELAPDIAAGVAEDARYSDADLNVDEVQDGLISLAALARFRVLLGALLKLDDAALLARLGRYLTRPKPWLRPEPAEAPLNAETLAARISAGEWLHRHGMALFARASLEHRHWLFASGASLTLEPAGVPVASLLCKRRSFPPDVLKPLLRAPGVKTLLAKLYNAGQLVLDSDL